MFDVALLEPEIPQNSGNIARTCAASRSRLHFIEPLGFELSDRYLKRSAMDYWENVDWQVWRNWTHFRSVAPDPVEEVRNDGAPRMWVIESDASLRYSDVRYRPGDFLLFGRESSGIPTAIREEYAATWVSIPMLNPAARSLNLSNCVALVLFEALRQNNFGSQATGLGLTN